MEDRILQTLQQVVADGFVMERIDALVYQVQAISPFGLSLLWFLFSAHLLMLSDPILPSSLDGALHDVLCCCCSLDAGLLLLLFDCCLTAA